MNKTPLASTREPIRQIQTGLADLGHAPGPLDGLFGTSTRGAAERWLAAGGEASAALAPVPVAPVTSALIYQGNARYPVRDIMVHCAATRPDWMDSNTLADKVAEIRRWHLANGWRDIGYHWILDRDGKSLMGRPETVIGSGAIGHNNGVIHICLLGGHGSAETDQFAEHYTHGQDITLRQMIDAISSRTAITHIRGHNEVAAKACPGFDVTTWLAAA